MAILLLKKRVNCDKTAYVLGSSLSMRSFAIEEAPFLLPALYATLSSTYTVGGFEKKGFTHLELSITCSKSFVCNIKTIIPQIIYYALSHVFCCVLCLAGVHCGQRGSSVGRYSWSGRVSRPEDTGSFFSTNNSMVINNVLKSDLREVNNKV